MTAISFISFAICLVIIVTSLRRGTDIFSPGRLFSLMWALVIGLTDLKFSGLQLPWTTEIWIQVLVGPFAFILGALVIYSINIDKKVYSINFTRSEKALFATDNNKIFSIVLILFFLFIVSYIIIYLKVGNIPIFARNPGKARQDFTMFGLGLFLHNVVLIVFFAFIYVIQEKKKRLQKSFLLLLSFVAVILYSMTLQRFQIFLTVFMVISFLYFTTSKLRFKNVIMIIIVIVTFFYLVSSFRAGQLVIYILYKISKMKYSVDYAIFTEPYMYVVMNLENYAHSISKIKEYTFGYYTFDFLTAVSGLKHWMEEYFALVENPFLISNNYNTYSAFWTYYRDFGILGIFVIPFIGGLSISSLYYSFKKEPTLKKLAFYSMMLFAILFSFFNSSFSFLWFVYNMFVLYVVFKFLNKPSME